ncbi:SpaH/EbpB family LPXTG-anchored major pilin [uncultured Dubosiella sp.]|uniref:SpaH/EbpB family LPXTG-anchored major pilin n=3 Tax=uncultured Dubosiella sp. TaxID=1937011 RepID=UPI0025B4873C|nr:SpaH/EbpB family LPXTG-anchored major pilin [uncultured Dubosiella sp.]
MKSLKKLLSIFAAFMMVVGLTAANVKAAGNGSITIDNPVEGTTYKVYKIFDVTYPEGEGTPTKYAYSIASNSPWFNTVKTYAEAKNSGITLTKAVGADRYTVTVTDKFNAAKFAKTLNGVLYPTPSIEVTADATLPTNGSYTASGLDLGYYFVDTGNGSLCNLTTTNPSQNIVDKNDVPFEKKADNNVNTNGVEVGQTVNYVIEGKIPYTEGFETYTYKVSDWMTEGLTYNKDAKLYVVSGEGESATETEITATTGTGDETKTNYTLTDGVTEQSSTKQNGFTMDIKVMNLQRYANQKIRIKYSATVNDQAVVKISENNAKLEYTNNADGTTTSTTKNVKTFSAKIVVDKYAENIDNDKDTSTKLSGATFILRRETKESTESNKIYEYYKYTAATATASAKVEWVTEDQKDTATKVTTDDKGEAVFNGLKVGTYELIETEAPAGYNLATDPIQVTVTKPGDNLTTEEAITTALTFSKPVANKTGSTLPSTGGMGTTMLYVAGAILMVGAAVIFVTNKRMKHE